MTATHILPGKPEIVLRVGFAGNRKLAEDIQPLRNSLDEIFTIFAHQLAGLSIRESKSQQGISKYYSTEKPPLLRLITGLAEGADKEAIDSLERMAGPDIAIRTELAAVLGCDIDTYRANRKPEHLEHFDKQLRKCAYVLALDGTYTPGDAGKPYRGRLYRAQAYFLPRHSDILIAVADPAEEAGTGGTGETIIKALVFGIPVIFIHAKTGKIKLIEPGSDIAAALAVEEPIHLLPPQKSWKAQLEEWIKTIVAEPATDAITDGDRVQNETRPKKELNLLQEYFETGTIPPRKRNGRQRKTFHERCWSWFENRFKPREIKVASDTPLGNYGVYRKRATDLNYHYSGLYRGTIIQNYLLAVVAVALAVISLVLSGKWPFISLILGLFKLFFLLVILYNSKRAHSQKWNDKAINYRYLAERLRTLFYLPLLGSYHPPAALPPQYSNHVLRQSPADWLFRAITRSVSPATFSQSTRFEFDKQEINVNLIVINPLISLASVKDKWIKNQLDYHKRNSQQMASMSRFLEKWASGLSLFVIVVVLIDVLLLLNERFDWSHDYVTTFLHEYSAVLISMAAVLPALVASFNGVRFQSECERLAERSAVLSAVLGGEDKSMGGKREQAGILYHQIELAQNDLHNLNPGSWNADVLRIGEVIAHNLTQEVAEWSVLYARELPEL